MSYFNERFGLTPIKLSKLEEQTLIEEIKIADEKRLEFFSLVSTIISLVLIILDYIYFNESNQKYYLVSDTVFFLYSFIVLILSLSFWKKFSFVGKIRHLFLAVYAMFILVWATIIAVADKESSLNILAFYVALFVMSFFLYSSFLKILYSFIGVLIIYSVVEWIKGEAFFSDTLFMIIAGYTVTTPFALQFKKTRYNTQAAQIKLRGINQNLEAEVNSRIKEQLKLNQDLELEIAQRKLVEIRLREALKKAEENDRLKSEFLANISHEIRTPLNAIIGFTQMIVDDNIAMEKKRIFQGLVEINTFYLLSVIDDVFDASLIQSEQLKTIIKPFGLNEFLRSLEVDAENCKSKYERIGLEVRWHFADKENLKISSDEFLLRKAMSRLIDNAFKFTHQGIVEIGVNVMQHSIEFFVTDTGIGIREEEKEKIFLPFVQGDGSFTRGYGGSGLGLAIAKGIAGSLRCELKLITEVGKGSCFSLLFHKDVFISNEIQPQNEH